MVAAGFTAVAGLSELTIRWPSAACGLLVVAVCVPLGRRLGGPALARWAAWLAATSPYLVFYDRTATPVALAALLTVLAVWWYLFLTSARAWPVVGFVGAMTFLGWASAALAPVALAQAAFLWLRRPNRRAWLLWAGGASLAVVAAAPWWVATAHELTVPPGQISHLPRETASLLYALIAPFAAFALGETLSVGHPVGLAGLAVMTGLTVGGIRRLQRAGRQFILVFWLLPVVWSATAVAATAPPADAAAVSTTLAYAWPAFGLAVASGMVALSPMARRLAYTSLVAIVAVSFGNYIHATTINQPSFLLPIDHVFRLVEARAEPSDVVIADRASMAKRFASRQASQLAVVDSTESAALDALLANAPPRLWHVAAPRGPHDAHERRVRQWLAEHYRAAEERRYAEEDSAVAWLQARLLGVESDAGLVLTLYRQR